MTTEELRAKIDELVDAGDESALETFLVEHFAELPEETQGKLLLGKFTDMLASREADTKMAEIQEGLLEAFDTLKDEK